jgi:hypothetical protein
MMADVEETLSPLTNVSKSEKSKRLNNVIHYAGFINQGDSEESIFELVHHTKKGKLVLEKINNRNESFKKPFYIIFLKVKEKNMFENFQHFSNSLNVHQKVKFNTCLADSYSFKKLQDMKYPISKNQIYYSKRKKAEENLKMEIEVNEGGRPLLKSESQQKIENFLFDHSTDSSKCVYNSFLIYSYINF